MHVCGRCILALVFLLSFSGACQAAAEDDPVLLVSGVGVDGELALTEQDVRDVPATTFTTLDPWDDKTRTYSGANILDLLRSLDLAEGVTSVELVARNDYRARITLAELERYAYILSYEMDGQDYSEFIEDDKGPLAVVVKMEQVEDEDRLRVKGQLVWWLERMVLQ